MLLEGEWPPLPHVTSMSAGLPAHAAPPRGDQASSSIKRPISNTSDSDSELPPRAPKTHKRRDSSSPPPGTPDQGYDIHIRPRPIQLHQQPSPSAPAAPAFAPRTDYVKLLFKGSPTVDTKIRWLSEVTRAFHLDRNLAEVKMAAVTSRFVYISRRRTDIVGTVTRGGGVVPLPRGLGFTRTAPQVSYKPPYSLPCLRRSLLG